MLVNVVIVVVFVLVMSVVCYLCNEYFKGEIYIVNPFTGSEWRRFPEKVIPEKVLIERDRDYYYEEGSKVIEDFCNSRKN